MMVLGCDSFSLVLDKSVKFALELNSFSCSVTSSFLSFC